MKKLLFLPIAFAALLMASCATYVSTSDIHEARMIVPTSPNPIVKALTVELDVNQGKVRDTWSFNRREVEALNGVDNIRNRSLCLSAEKHNADIMVGVLYNITFEGNGSCTVVLTGYPAVYKNWETFQAADTIYLGINPTEPIRRR